MRSLQAWLMHLALWTLLSVGAAGWAQTNLDPATVTTSPTSDTSTDSSGRIVSSDQIDRELDLKEDSLIEMLRTERPEYPKLSPAVRRKLYEFKRQRDRYLLEQQRLIKQFKGATDEERDQIRDRLRERRLEWMERSRSFRDTTRERLRDIVRELPKHREALEAAREDAREEARQEVKEIRERPRLD